MVGRGLIIILWSVLYQSLNAQFPISQNDDYSKRKTSNSLDQMIKEKLSIEKDIWKTKYINDLRIQVKTVNQLTTSHFERDELERYIRSTDNSIMIDELLLSYEEEVKKIVVSQVFSNVLQNIFEYHLVEHNCTKEELFFNDIGTRLRNAAKFKPIFNISDIPKRKANSFFAEGSLRPNSKSSFSEEEPPNYFRVSAKILLKLLDYEVTLNSEVFEDFDLVSDIKSIIKNTDNLAYDDEFYLEDLDEMTFFDAILYKLRLDSPSKKIDFLCGNSINVGDAALKKLIETRKLKSKDIFESAFFSNDLPKEMTSKFEGFDQARKAYLRYVLKAIKNGQCDMYFSVVIDGVTYVFYEGNLINTSTKPKPKVRNEGIVDSVPTQFRIDIVTHGYFKPKKYLNQDSLDYIWQCHQATSIEDFDECMRHNPWGYSPKTFEVKSNKVEDFLEQVGKLCNGSKKSTEELEVAKQESIKASNENRVILEKLLNEIGQEMFNKNFTMSGQRDGEGEKAHKYKAAVDISTKDLGLDQDGREKLAKALSEKLPSNYFIIKEEMFKDIKTKIPDRLTPSPIDQNNTRKASMYRNGVIFKIDYYVNKRKDNGTHIHVHDNSLTVPR